jgi:hypothetical protein
MQKTNENTKPDGHEGGGGAAAAKVRWTDNVETGL